MPHLVPAVLVLEGVKYCRGYSVVPNSAGKITGVATGTNQEGLGALTWADGFLERNYETGTPPAAKYRNVSLDLHNGTAIFGASNTVQPASIRFLCLIRSY